MKKTFILLVLLASAFTLYAKNDVVTVAQVTESVDITKDVDYVITGNTPFGTMGSVNIKNLDHAVVIIQKIKPSKVISTLMNNIFINGVKAVNGSNCQVKMYNRGAIIMPYDRNFKPLTCYTEKNFGGDSYNGYTIGHDGNGYMKTLSASELNNNIRSFILKRGHMVTFATGTNGWGYSRCYIADDADLEIASLPNVLDGKISSYRVFQWYNASKAGVHHTGKDANNKLNTTSCFDWGTGNASLLPDVEWVPNHIYEDWPSSGACGKNEGSCHMKTNNEPANSADDHPQTVTEVLNNWQNLMRTGMRLCSPATHDGGWGWHDEFMKAIDEKGWRCDLVDFHGYWDGEWGSLDWRIDKSAYNRPVWFSEWLWGASWNHNGAFASGRQSEAATYNGTKPILDRLNSNNRVERFYYWNSEQWYTKIIRDDGSLTQLGEYYSKMETSLGFKGNNAPQYTPKVVITTPGEVKSTPTKTAGLNLIRLSWSDPNGDMVDSIIVQHKDPESTKWENIRKVNLKDVNSKTGVTYTVSDTLVSAAKGIDSKVGIHSYRIATYSASKFKDIDNTVVYSNVVTTSVTGCKKIGDMQYGQITYSNYNNNVVDIESCVDPVAIVSIPSAANTASINYGACGQLPVAKITNSITWSVKSWYKDSNKKEEETPLNERADFVILPHGNYCIDDNFFIEVCDSVTIKQKGEVVFNHPWPEGEIPVVIPQILSGNSYGITYNIYDVTNTGFKIELKTQKVSVPRLWPSLKVSYIAISKGHKDLGCGLAISSGLLTDSDGNVTTTAVPRVTALIQGYFEGRTLTEPYILIAPQQNNYKVSADMVRINKRYSTYVSLRRSFDGSAETTPTTADIKDVDQSNTIGYIAISKDGNATTYPDPTMKLYDCKYRKVGDINTDKKINSTDIVTIISYLLGENENLSGLQMLNADVNNDGVVDTKDIKALQEKVLNK